MGRMEWIWDLWLRLDCWTFDCSDGGGEAGQCPSEIFKS